MSKPPKKHTKEHLGHLENRINVAIFGAQAVPAFWRKFCHLLKIDVPPETAWLDRIIVDKTSLRPDFIFMHESEERFWLEVELGGRDPVQLAKYRQLAPYRVRFIVGLASNTHGDASLEQVSVIATEALQEIGDTNLQGRAILSALVELIDPKKLGAYAKAAIYDIPLDIADRFPTLLAPLLDLKEHGLLINRPHKETSLSLRLTASHYLASHGSFALVTMNDGTHLQVPVPAEMERVLKGALASLVGDWRPLLDSVYPPWKGHQKGKRVPIPYDVMAQNEEKFAEFYTKIRNLLVSTPFSPVA